MGLSWIQDWVKLENDLILNLEGYNMIYGCHPYLFYQKDKRDRFFRYHIIRESLYTIWQKYKRNIGEKRPLWLVPMEIIKLHTDYRPEEKLTYKDLIYWTGTEIKLKEEENISVKIGWWRYNQIKDLFCMDKRTYGFRKEDSELEKVLTGGKEKVISKIYKVLLGWYTEDETVKVQMISWAENFNKNIS